jgi:hypothetical protein
MGFLNSLREYVTGEYRYKYIIGPKVARYQLPDIDLTPPPAGPNPHDENQDQWIQYLHQENRQLKLYLAALTRLLIETDSVSREQLLAAIDTLDRSDGAADGGFDGPVVDKA